MNWVPFLKEVADKADRISRSYFRNQKLESALKANQTLVSQADLEIEMMVRKAVSDAFPDVGVFGEEFENTPSKNGTQLIIDPIDSTQNFLRGIPIFGTLLAIETDGQLVAGFVSAPALDTQWWAESGQGAFCNNERIHVSSIADMKKGLVLFGSLSGQEAEKTPAGCAQFLTQFPRQRAFGDFYNHLLVAMGSAEIALDFGLNYWDLAALMPIVTEAGGACMNRYGKADFKTGDFISTNGQHWDLTPLNP